MGNSRTYRYNTSVMRRFWLLLLTLTSLFGGKGAASTSPALSLLGRLPLRFEANRGQADAGVCYVARGGAYSVALTDRGSFLRLRSGPEGRPTVVETRFLRASAAARIEPEELSITQTNYLRGNASEWITGVASYARVRYRGLYPGIDVVFYGNEGKLEYDILVAPGARVSAVLFSIAGIASERLDNDGNLVLTTSAGRVMWQKPVVYQIAGTGRKAIPGRLVLRGRRRIGFAVGSYDHNLPLIIDPTLNYATFLGGSGNEAARAISVDGQGNVYIAGFSDSLNLPFTAGSVQAAYRGGSASFSLGGDAFIAKINPQGTAVVYNTYLGGNADDVATALAIDGSGNAYVAGFTNSNNFPVTPGAASRTFGGAGGNQFHHFGDAFVAKLSPDGKSLLYATFLGGSQDDAAMAIALDSQQNAYIAGITQSPNLPATGNAYQKTYRGSGGQPPFCAGCGPNLVSGDVFVARLSPDGAAWNFVTYLGGASDDMAGAIAVDATGVYVAGSTLSRDFPTTSGAFSVTYRGASMDNLQPVMKFGDAFLAKLSLDGSRLLASTLLGGTSDDAITAVALDQGGSGAVYVTGNTQSSDFPTTAGAYSAAFKGPRSIPDGKGVLTGDCFVAKIAADFRTLVFSTYIGGSFDDGGLAIATDSAGDALVAGFTYSSDFPVTSDALQRPPAGNALAHGFLLRLSPTGTALQYSTILGGNSSDIIFAMAVDTGGNAYLAGNTDSSNFPVTSGVLQSRFAGDQDSNGPMGDAFVAKIAGVFPAAQIQLNAVTNAASYASGGVSAGEIVTLFGGGMGPSNLVTAAVDSTTGRLATSLSGARVLFDGIAAPLVYVSDKQSSAVVPYEALGHSSTQVTVEYNGASSSALTLPVVAAAPGLFSANQQGRGPGAIYNQDNTVNSSSNPASSGQIIVLYGTGEGQTVPPVSSGTIANSIVPKPVQPVSVTIGGIAATDIRYAGTVPSFVVGLLQINVVVPTGVPPGDQPVEVTIGSAKSQANLTVAIR